VGVFAIVILMNIDWQNPYEDVSGQWYKGNLHAHTRVGSGCGTLDVDRVLELYVQAGYDFLSISDHMNLTLAADHAPAALASRLAMIPGIEWNATGGIEHTGVYSFDLDLLRRCTRINDQAPLLESLATVDALVIFNHPNWQLTPHYRREKLLARQGYHGVEVYNHVIERLDGYAISSDKWDFLLKSGRRVLGFASDDSHNEADINGAALHVRAPRRDARAIYQAIGRGNFYVASGGMTLDKVTRQGDVVTVVAPAAQEIRAIANGGTRIARKRGTELSVKMSEVPGEYVRFEAYGEGASIAWTQPLFKIA